MNKLLNLFYRILLLGISLSGCSYAKKTPVNFPYIEASATPAFSTVPTSLTKTDLPSSIPILTPVIVPAETDVVPLTKSDAEKKVITLLADNAGCRLPCFWGFIPHQTSEQTLIAFFYQLYNLGGRDIEIEQNNSNLSIFVTWSSKGEPGDSAQNLYINIQDYRYINLGEGRMKQAVYDNPTFKQLTRYYSLSNLLSLYGPPKQAYIGIELGKEMGFEDIFHLYLDYPESGWSVQFKMPLQKENRAFIGCPTQAFTSLSVHASEDKTKASEDLENFRKYIFTHPLPEVTSLTLETFHQQFKDTANTLCIQTPVEKWKELLSR